MLLLLPDPFCATGIGKDDGAPEARQLSRAWTRGCRERHVNGCFIYDVILFFSLVASCSKQSHLKYVDNYLVSVSSESNNLFVLFCNSIMHLTSSIFYSLHEPFPLILTLRAFLKC